MVSFNIYEDVECWVRDNGRPALDALLVGSRISANDRHIAREWIAIQDARQASELAERSVKATETVANAAQESANAARLSAKFAIWAVIVSVVALFVSVFK